MKRHPRLRKVVIILAVLFAIFNVFIFFIFPPLARHIGMKKGSEALGRTLTIGEIRVNPYTLTATVRDVLLKDLDGTSDFASVKEVHANLQAESIFRLAPVVKCLYVIEPYAHVVRLDATRFNFSDLIKPSEPKADTEPVLFSLNDIRIIGGRVDYDDLLVKKSHVLGDVNLTIPSVSNFARFIDRDVQPTFSATFDGSPIVMNGRSKPFVNSMETTISFSIEELDITKYLAYSPMPLTFQMPSASLSFNADVAYTQFQDRAPSLVATGNVMLKEIVVQGLDGASVISLPGVNVTQYDVRPLENKASVGQILIDHPILNVARNASGEINLMSMLPPTAPAQAEPSQTTEQAPAAAPFIVTLNEVKLVEGTVSWKDAVPKALADTAPVEFLLDHVTMDAANISTAPNSKGTVAFSTNINGDGKLDTKTTVCLDPLSADVQLALQSLQFKPFQPYVQDFAKLSINDGSLSVTGAISCALPPEGPAVNFKGDVSVDNLAMADQLASDELVKWESLKFIAIDANTTPMKVAIQEISLSNPSASIIINPNGAINLTEILATPVPAEPVRAETAPAVAESAPEIPLPVIEIGKVSIAGGQFNFTDRTVNPEYMFNLAQMDLSLEGFSMGMDQIADINFQGKVDRQSPVSINGKLRPDPKNPFVDMQIYVSGVDLSPATPYSGKFVGLGIEKGKLNLDLAYRVENRNLKSQNRVLIDQFTFGDKIESPTATKLPVRLALALLKDRHGQVKLDIPVSGSLDDPKFRVLPVVLQVLVNLIEKAVTSPFAFLGGGEESSFAEFDFGSATINEAAQKKLDKIAEMLADRPALRLDIRAQTISTADDESIRREYLMRKLQVQKLRDSKEKVAPALDDIVIDPAEYERYLKKAYEAEEMPNKPKVLGVTKSQPVHVMEEMLLSTITVTPDDLRRLAYRRAAAVRDYLIAKGSIEAERVFLVEPEPLSGSEKPRTNFALKLAEESAGQSQFSVAPEASPQIAIEKPSKRRKVLIGGGIGLVGILALLAL